MFRPIVCVAIAFAVGIALGGWSSLSAWAWLALSGLCAVAAVSSLAMRRSAAVPMLLGTLTAGAMWCTLHADPPAAEVLTTLVGQDVTVTGTVVRPPQISEDRTRAVISIERVTAGGRGSSAYGLVAVSLPGSNSIGYGDRVVLSGRLVRPPPAGNPGEFSYRDYLAARGITAVLYPRRGKLLRVVGKGQVNPLLAAADAVRRRMTAFFQTAMPGRRGALMASLLLGDDGAIGPQAKDDFARSGLLHVLVVSGAQVGLVLGSVLWLGRALRAPPGLSAAVAGATTIFFALMAGWVPSVARAAVMALAGLAAPVLRRNRDAYAALALAALALLLAQPLLLFDAGFQLSFAATWALVYIAPALAAPLSALPSSARSLIAMTASAQIAVAPLLAYHFLQVSLAGFIANLIVIPLVALLVPAGFIVALVGAVLPLLAAPAAVFLGPPADAVWWVAALFAHAPLAAIPVAPPSLPEMLIFYGLIVAAVEWRQGRLRVSKVSALAAAAAVAAFALWANVLAAASPAHLAVTFLDVGQGDAIVVQAPSGRAVVIDGGGEVEGHLTGYDVGARRVVPALRRLHLRSIDIVILTHPHEDHVGGLVAVLQTFAVGLVLDGGIAHPAPSYERFLRLIDARHVPYRLARRGQRLDLGGGVAAAILNPPEPPVTGSGSDVNMNSVVARFVYGTVGLLLTGDIEAMTEERLMHDGDNLHSMVLKVAHHGSMTSSTPAFLAAVAPRVAVISVGAVNPFGHPHRVTLDALQAVGAEVYRTDLDGAVTVTSDGARLWVQAVRRTAGR